MNSLKSIWGWLNGKKSAIGGYILLGVQVASYLVARYDLHIYHYEFAIKIATDIGDAFAGIGVLHKLTKAQSDPPV